MVHPTSKTKPRRATTVAVAVPTILALAWLFFIATARCRDGGNSSSWSSWGPRNGRSSSLQITRDAEAQQRERLAVLIPYRDRTSHLARMLPVTAACLEHSGVEYSIFVLEQAPGLHFNRGALLNAGALFLAGSEYDCLVFHDVDTVCSAHKAVMYRCPRGKSPLHLTPPGLHPRDDYPEFLGGNIVFTQEQFARVNGFQHSFWGWGKEDNNMVRRLQLHGMWPPERPSVQPRPQKDYYWVHMDHAREPVVTIKEHAPRNSMGLANLEPRVHDDNRSGLRETLFRIKRIDPMANATRILLQLGCDRALTPWCDQQTPAALLNSEVSTAA